MPSLNVVTIPSVKKPIQPSPANDRTLSQEEMQTKTAKRPSAYETGQKTKLSSRNEASHSVDIKA